MMTRSVQQQQCGFTLIESIISILVVGVMFVASMSVLSQSRLSRFISADGLQGQLLADALMSEILQQSYQEPVVEFSSLGVDVSEDPEVRTMWNDVDDYEGWTASPPQDKYGTVMTGLSGWTRSVEVSYVNLSNLMTPVGADTGIKIITVLVLHNNRQVAKLCSVRTGAAQSRSEIIEEIEEEIGEFEAVVK